MSTYYKFPVVKRILRNLAFKQPKAVKKLHETLDYLYGTLNVEEQELTKIAEDLSEAFSLEFNK
jgi:DNA-directed RNA polymerase subunit F